MRGGAEPLSFSAEFRRLIRLTPRQYLLRLRLREAAKRLATERAKVFDIALDCGFGDLEFQSGFSERIWDEPAGVSAARAATSD